MMNNIVCLRSFSLSPSSVTAYVPTCSHLFLAVQAPPSLYHHHSWIKMQLHLRIHSHPFLIHSYANIPLLIHGDQSLLCPSPSLEIRVFHSVLTSLFSHQDVKIKEGRFESSYSFCQCSRWSPSVCVLTKQVNFGCCSFPTPQRHEMLRCILRISRMCILGFLLGRQLSSVVFTSLQTSTVRLSESSLSMPITIFSRRTQSTRLGRMKPIPLVNISVFQVTAVSPYLFLVYVSDLLPSFPVNYSDMQMTLLSLTLYQELKTSWTFPTACLSFMILLFILA